MEEAVDYRWFNLARYRKSFDVAFDTADASSPGQCLSVLAPNGVGLHIKLTPIKMISVILTRRDKAVIAKTTPAILEKIAELAANGSFKLPISGVVPLAQAIPAITKLEKSGHPKGKLVIVPD